MLSNCNTAATQILNISHSKEKKKNSTVMDIEEFIFTAFPEGKTRCHG